MNRKVEKDWLHFPDELSWNHSSLVESSKGFKPRSFLSAMSPLRSSSAESRARQASGEVLGSLRVGSALFQGGEEAVWKVSLPPDGSGEEPVSLAKPLSFSGASGAVGARSESEDEEKHVVPTAACSCSGKNTSIKTSAFQKAKADHRKCAEVEYS